MLIYKGASVLPPLTLLFLCFSIFIIGNLVISVIVEQVFIIAKKYDYDQEQIREAQRKKDMGDLKKMFDAISIDDRTFDYQEFYIALNSQGSLG